MKNKIYIKDWLSLKPYEKQVATDSYYLSISNKVYQCFYEKQALPVLMYLHNDEVKMLSCFLTSYFEDVISDTNMWNTFINIHFKMYRKILPFYSTDEY